MDMPHESGLTSLWCLITREFGNPTCGNKAEDNSHKLLTRFPTMRMVGRGQARIVKAVPVVPPGSARGL